MAEVKIPFTSEELPLENLKQFIDQGIIKNEIPFDLLFDQYPSLVDEWYPGYPGEPRKMTKEDPHLALGFIQDGYITFKDIPGLENSPVLLGEDCDLEGEYNVWVQCIDDEYVFKVLVEENVPDTI